MVRPEWLQLRASPKPASGIASSGRSQALGLPRAERGLRHLHEQLLEQPGQVVDPCCCRRLWHALLRSWLPPLGGQRWTRSRRVGGERGCFESGCDLPWNMVREEHREGLAAVDYRDPEAG